MSDSSDIKLDDFERALARLLGEHAVVLEPRQLVDVLQDHAQQLLHGSSRQIHCRQIGSGSAALLEIGVTYASARALERDLGSILAVGALQVPSTVDAVLLSQARVLLGAKNVPEALTFNGRIVNKSDAGLAVQLEEVDAQARATLLSWPDKMRGIHTPATPERSAADALAPDSEVVVASSAGAAATRERKALAHPGASTQPRKLLEPRRTKRTSQPHRSSSRPEASAQAEARPQRLPEQPDLRARSAIFDSNWDLSQVSFDHILRILASRRGRGILELSRLEEAGLEGREGTRRVQLLIAEGHLLEMRVQPAQPHHSLGAYLLRKDRLSADIVRELFDRVTSSGITEAQALLQRPGDLARRSALASIRSHLARMFVRLEVDELDQARFFTSGSTQLGQTATGVPLARLLFLRAKIAHRDTPDALDKRFSRSAFRRAAWPSIAAEDLGLSPAERQLLDCFLADANTLEQVLKRSPMTRAETAGTLAGFQATGLLEWECDQQGVADTAGFAKRNQLDAQTIDVICQKVAGTDDPFALLGLHWTSYDSEVRRRFEMLRSLVQDINLPVGLERERRRSIKKVRAQLHHAYDQIREAPLRKKYRDQHLSKRRQQSVAEELESLADQAMSRQKFTSSLDFYQRLLEIVPEHRRAGSLLPKLLVRAQMSR